MWDRYKLARWKHVLQLLLVLLLCITILGAKLWFPETAAVVETWLIGDTSNPVVQAFSALENGMSQGDGTGQAVQAFCAEIAGHGIS